MKHDLTEFATGLNLPEGPVVLGDGDVVVVEQFIGALTRVVDGVRQEIARPGGALNAATVGPDGTFYVTNNWHAHDGWRMPEAQRRGLPLRSGRLQAVTAAGVVEDLYEGCDGEYLIAPSDLVVDSGGWCYFTDFYGHKVLRGRVDGSSIEVVARSVPFANGICLSDDERRLYVAEYRLGTIACIELSATGEIGRRRTFAELPAGGSPDGLCLDEAGYLLAASATSGELVVFDPEGFLETRIEMPDRVVTNLAFGGSDHRDLFITMAPSIPDGGAMDRRDGRVMVMSWERPGLRLHSQRGVSAAGRTKGSKP